MINVTEAQHVANNQHNDPDAHPELRPSALAVAGDLGANNVLLRQALQMLGLVLSGVERPHFFRTTPCYLSSGTVVSNVKVLALDLLESFDSLQLTLSSCAHRYSPVRNGKFIIALSVVLPALTPISKLSVRACDQEHRLYPY